MEKVLAYDRSIVAQDNGWFCGPAATQIVLDGRGIRRTESDLAKRMGTHTGGTDHIGLPAKVLAAELPGVKWTTVQMPNDPPTAAQKDRLWADLVRSIDAGYGVVMNIVAPPSNYPRAVAPSTQSLRYSGGVVYHYVALMGYGIDPDGRRRVWWADSGFPPYGSWVSFEQTASLCPPKGYVAASPLAAPTPTPTPAPAPPASTPAGSVPRFETIQLLGQSHQPRTKTPINFLIHTEEGNASALDLAKYCNNTRNQVSYHYTLRDQKLVALVPLERAAWSVLDANAYTINLCFAGSRASWTRQQWLARREDIRIAAYVAVRDCRRFGIPPTVITPPYRRGSGISDHAYVTRCLGIGTHLDVGNQFPWDVFAADVAAYAGPPVTGNLIDAEAQRAKAWIGRRLTDGETSLRGGGVKIGAFAEFEHAHIYWKMGASTAIAIPHADPDLPGTGLFETWAADYRFELGPLGFPVLAHALVTNGAVQAFEHGVLHRKNGSPRGWAVWGRIYHAYASLGSEQGPLGWPISGEEAVPGTDNIRQRFETGALVWSPTGVAVVLDKQFIR